MKFKRLEVRNYNTQKIAGLFIIYRPLQPNLVGDIVLFGHCVLRGFEAPSAKILLTSKFYQTLTLKKREK